MELIVKVGVDQAGLQQSISRMRQQFNNMNMSSPAAWSSMPRMTPGQMSAYSAPTGGDSLGSILGRIGPAQIFKGIIGGTAVTMVMSQLKELFDWTSQKFSKSFWENVYGINDEMINRVKAAHETLRKSVGAVLELRKKEAEDTDKRLIQNASPESRRRLLEQRERETRAAVATAEKDFKYAKRAAKESVGVGGAPLSARQQMQLTTELADAEKKLIEARMKHADVSEQYRKSLDEVVKAGVAATTAEKKKQEDQDKEDLKRFGMKPTGQAFQADALAQAGLFAGSSLVQNPVIGIQTAQLDVLRRIETNTSKGMFA